MLAFLWKICFKKVTVKKVAQIYLFENLFTSWLNSLVYLCIQSMKYIVLAHKKICLQIYSEAEYI